MRIDTFSAWHDQETAVIQPSGGATYCGIAIGPGSHEGIVEIDGFPLQAGRILPLRSDKYTARKVRPLTARLPTPDPALDCIQHLELVLFTDPGELGCTLPRADGYFDARGFAASGALAPVMNVPFVGRRQALFMIHSPDLGAGTFSYTVYGVRYQRSSRAIERYPLHVAVAVTLSSVRTLAFYIGGFDNEEQWDVLDLRLGVAAGKTFNVDVQTTGELGAY